MKKTISLVSLTLIGYGFLYGTVCHSDPPAHISEYKYQPVSKTVNRQPVVEEMDFHPLLFISKLIM